MNSGCWQKTDVNIENNSQKRWEKNGSEWPYKYGVSSPSSSDGSSSSSTSIFVVMLISSTFFLTFSQKNKFESLFFCIGVSANRNFEKPLPSLHGIFLCCIKTLELKDTQ